MKSVLLIVALVAMFGLGYYSHAYAFRPADPCVVPVDNAKTVP
jgi:hypothetical protein